MSSRVVVGAAIVRDGLLLAAQRAHPAELAGRWELPGGRVEPGELEPAALRRECAEELEVDVRIGDRVGTDVVLPGGASSDCSARPSEGRAEPCPSGRSGEVCSESTNCAEQSDLRPTLLRIYAATLNPGSEPRAVQHKQLSWLPAAELATVDWLPADRELLPALATLLQT